MGSGVWWGEAPIGGGAGAGRAAGAGCGDVIEIEMHVFFTNHQLTTKPAPSHYDGPNLPAFPLPYVLIGGFWMKFFFLFLVFESFDRAERRRRK